MTLSNRSFANEAWGRLIGVGVGPGDPELLTLKGLRLIQNAPIVMFPAGTKGQKGVAQRIISPWLQPEQLQRSLHFPYVQDLNILQEAWKKSAEIVLSFLRNQQDVVFCTEGDVSFYSTFTYLAQTVLDLEPSVRVECVPGVSSPMAAAAALSVPLTVTDQRLLVLPALYTVEALEAALGSAEVLVLMKVASVYAQVWQVLKEHGYLKSSFVVERASSPQQVIYRDLSDRPNLKLSYFSILIVQPPTPCLD